MDSIHMYAAGAGWYNSFVFFLYFLKKKTKKKKTITSIQVLLSTIFVVRDFGVECSHA